MRSIVSWRRFGVTSDVERHLEFHSARHPVTPRLTIVLPLKGRHLFTLRFLWHANRARLPYRILIADGEVHPLIARLLENPRNIFPELDIEYVRYPNDVDFSHFFVKMADALARVRTPYAMLADNDDFLGFAGIERSLDFIETHSDYVASAGRIAGFSVYSGVNNPSGGLVGKLNRLCMYYDDGKEISSPVVAERLRQGALRLWIYYAVSRTEALGTICREVAEIDFTDLLLHESFHIMRVLSLGKVHEDRAAVSYFRQYGTSTVAAFNRDWVSSLVRGRFTSNVQAVTERISMAAAPTDKDKAANVSEYIIAMLESRFKQFVRANYGAVQQTKQFIRRRAPNLVGWVQNRPRFFIGREGSALLRKLADAGASHESVVQFQDELAAIEAVIAGDAFSAFVQPYLAALHPDAPAQVDRRFAGQPSESGPIV
jgi:glycosyltransferase domain-containing protein